MDDKTYEVLRVLMDANKLLDQRIRLLEQRVEALERGLSAARSVTDMHTKIGGPPWGGRTTS